MSMSKDFVSCSNLGWVFAAINQTIERCAGGYSAQIILTFDSFNLHRQDMFIIY